MFRFWFCPFNGCLTRVAITLKVGRQFVKMKPFSTMPNPSLQPTICPVAESCTLSALHNSTSGQIAAELNSYA